MTAASSGLRIGRMRIGVHGKIRLGCFQRKAITSKVRRTATEPLIKEPCLKESVEIPIRAAGGFQLFLGGGDRAQGLDG